MSKILYIAPVKDFSGYANAARGYIRALHQAGADLVVRAARYDLADHGTQYQPTEVEQELLGRDLKDIDIVIQHVTPNEMRPAEGKVNIAICAWETTRIPQYWADKLNKFDAVITFCEASIQAFLDCGVTVPIHKIPHTFDIPSYTLDESAGAKLHLGPPEDFFKDRTVFLNISQFSNKKGIDVLLRAYYGAFYDSVDDVVLILKTYVNMQHRDAEQKRLQGYIEGVKQNMRLPGGNYPKIILITPTMSDENIRKLYSMSDVYICSSRAEGWCIPAFEALAYGKKLVTTQWGGMGEFTFVTADAGMRAAHDAGHLGLKVKPNVYPVRYSLEPLVGQNHPDPELYTSLDYVAEPSVCSMIIALQEAQVSQLQEPASFMEYDYSEVGPTMLSLIESIVVPAVPVEEVQEA